MNILLYYIKGLFTTLNAILFLLLLFWGFRRKGKTGWARGIFYFTVILFLFCATPFLPKYFAAQLESKYLPLNTDPFQGSNQQIYIHVLGSGFGQDNRLPATAQLAPVAQGRLMEGLRLLRVFPHSMLVCSAGTIFGTESQASVTRKAAILLGADSSRIITLDAPLTTAQEAQALALKMGKDISLILVTDAIHMPRAIATFIRQGFHPLPAPTNYRVLFASNAPPLDILPSINNMSLLDKVIHEWLGRLKSST